VATTTPDAAIEASPHDRELVALWELEKQQRRTINFATLPASDATLGSDPYRITRVGDHFIGLLRGESAVVLLDDRARELGRVPMRSPSALAMLPDGSVLVVGDATSMLVHLRVEGELLIKVELPIANLYGARGLAVAADGKTAYVVEDHTGRLLSYQLRRDGTSVRVADERELGRCHGPIAVRTLDDLIVTNCLLDRALEIRRGTAVQRIQHDGPLWSFELLRTRDGVILAAGGVEDHPLEREDGGFGYVDSYLFLYKLERDKPTRLAAVNLGESRGITPKWLEIFEDGPRLAVETAGFGGGRQIIVSWPTRRFDQQPDIKAWAMPPGTVDAAKRKAGGLILANTLFDGWVVVGGGGEEVAIVPAGKPSTRTLEARVGELLFFTELMAPWSGTEGKRSRFTCETCHHEGYIDGRTHYTGREHGGLKVHAATRPLRGLFNNAPYFSRALDQSMTQMVHSEFKVANRHTGRDPWFELTAGTIDWWKYVAGMPRSLKPEMLRESLMRFLIEFTHRSNPVASNHTQFTAIERRGAEAFRARCTSCHAARLIAEEPPTEIGFDRWEKLVLSAAGPIVWNNAAYATTGVAPYVHDAGTRVPTLRRLYKKWPYFTNGSAKSLGEVLERFAYDGTTGMHDHAPAAMTRLTAEEKTALLAFLDLL